MVNLIFLTKGLKMSWSTNHIKRSKRLRRCSSKILEVEEFLSARMRNNLQGFRKDHRKLFFARDGLTEITEGSWLSDDGSLTILMPLAFLEDSNLPRFSFCTKI